MISVSLMGGLGNQLFQIASTYAHAKDHGFDVGFDISHTHLPLQGKTAIKYKDNIYWGIPKIRHTDYQLVNYKITKWEYAPLPVKDNLLIDGYLQSPKYFHHRRDELLGMFISPVMQEGTISRLKIKYKDKLNNSVAIHVRRGDYLKLSDFHPTLPPEYYTNALNHIKTHTTVGDVFVFSDDIAWCVQNIKADRLYFIEKQSDIEDMMLMGLCSHNITANSTFSWWGAYFNKNPHKIVCVPRAWCGKKAGHLWDDIYLSEMQII